jgi:predicted metallo-beta-lactamase superfamily hydrolase
MKIEVLGTESLGVRGLCCVVEIKNRKIAIDPGIALGWSRFGFLPHPFQIAVGVGIRGKIIEELKNATDVVFSHFDGDHVPLLDANPYQLRLDLVKDSLSATRIWAKGPKFSSETQKKRREEVEEATRKELPNAEGKKDEILEFSSPVPHGEAGSEKGMLMMTRIKDGKEVFVHASDIQLFDEETIEKILDWKPNIVLASGPPLYRLLSSSKTQKEKAWQNATKLSKNVDTLILDHHLLRSEEGIEWLKNLAKNSGHEVLCAANFMKREPLLLEAWRKELYQWLPVPKEWHEDYAQGKVGFADYRAKGWEVLIKNKKIKPCKHYPHCPIVRYTKQGKLDRYWIENYCLVSNKNCVRYQMEERGEFHLDNMLPNGEMRED